jgi:hypothetical protein
MLGDSQCRIAEYTMTDQELPEILLPEHRAAHGIDPPLRIQLFLFFDFLLDRLSHDATSLGLNIDDI